MSTAVPENVQEYPRPPRLEQTKSHLKVLLNKTTLADTTRAYRVLETHHPPTYYIPIEDCNTDIIKPSSGGTTICEWKGKASYFDAILPDQKNIVQRRIWSYQNPTPEFKPIAGFLSFYASPFECYVDGELVKQQPGDFYGGWVTSNIQGIIKGSPGTYGW